MGFGGEWLENACGALVSSRRTRQTLGLRWDLAAGGLESRAMGDSCFLNRFRGLDLIEAREQGISPGSFYTDSTGGNVFHVVLFCTGLVLNLAGRWQRSFTLCTVGYLIGGLSCFFIASGLMTYFPDFYSCNGLGIFSFGGGALVALYISKVMGEEKTFEVLGSMLGFMVGLLFYGIIGRQFDTGITALGHDFMELIFTLGGGAVGFVVVGKVEWVRKSVLVLYSSLTGAIMLVMAFDYMALARMGDTFQPANTGVEDTVAEGVVDDIGMRLAIGGLASIVLFIGGFYFQNKKLDIVLVKLGLADAATVQKMKEREAAALALAPPVPAPPSSDLPPGWESAVDAKSGKTYWFNRSTGETRWTPPKAAPAAPGSKSAPPPPKVPRAGPPPRSKPGKPAPPPRRP